MMTSVRPKKHAYIESYIRLSGQRTENICNLLQMQISIVVLEVWNRLGLACTNYSSTQELKACIPYGYRSPLTYSLVSVQLSRSLEYWPMTIPMPRPSPSSDMPRFSGSSTRKALDFEVSNGLVCKFKAQDVFRSRCYPWFLYHGSSNLNGILRA